MANGLTPLNQLIGNQPSIQQQTNQLRQGRRENELAQLLQPVRMRAAELQGQEQEQVALDSQKKRLGQAANVFLGALGDVSGLDQNEVNQRWIGAKNVAQEAGFDLSVVPDQFSDQWHGFAQRISQQAGGSQSIDLGAVGAQKILDDGTVVQSTRGGTVVFSPTGQRLTGQDAAEAIKKAQEFGADIQQKRSFGRTTGKLEADIGLGGQAAGTKKAAEQAIQLSGEAFAKLAPIRTSIANVNEAISLIDQGAETGVIAGRLPSIKEASIRLDNLQQQMGLDVIGNTTFGALSESELRFALDSALPKKLEGAQLKQWLVDKREAQQKLADYLSSTAEYLGRPGNTVAGWLEFQRNQQQNAQQPSSPQSGSQIKFLGFE